MSWLLRGLFSGCIILLSAGCAASPPKPESVPLHSEASEESSALPFNLVITDEVNDGATLRVVGRVSSQTDWLAEGVLLHFVGLKEGRTVSEEFKNLAHFVGAPAGGDARITPQQPVLFSLSLPSAALSDYQLELLWGEDAAPYLDRGRQIERAVLRDVILQEQEQPGECAASSCRISYALTGNLVNQWDRVINKVTLSVGFTPVAGGAAVDLSPIFPENGEKVEVVNLGLRPGERRQIRLVMQDALPAAERNRYQPQVKILACE